MNEADQTSDEATSGAPVWRLDWSNISAFALVIVVFAIGWQIPLPGLNLETLAGAFQSEAAARLSIMALGVVPLLTILAFNEAARLAFPIYARWQGETPRNTTLTSLVISVLALGLTASQAYGIFAALEEVDLVRLDINWFEPLAASTMIASTALLVWIIYRLRPQEPGSGLWFVLAVPMLSSLPRELVYTAEMARHGMLSSQSWSGLAALFVVACGLAAFANLLIGNSRRSNNRTALLLWPPILAGILANYCLAFAQTIVPGWSFSSVSSITAALLTLMALFMPFLTMGYARLIRAGSNDADLPSQKVVAIVAIQIVLCVAMEILPVRFGVPISLSGSNLLILTTVMMSMVKRG